MLLAPAACQRVAPASPASPAKPSPAGAPARAEPRTIAPPTVMAQTFACNLMLGVGVTAEWFDAGFERVVDDARWEAITKPHTSLAQWADEQDSVWSLPPTSPCAERALQPDRVLFTAMNWEYKTAAEWEKGLSALVVTLLIRFPSVRQIVLLTLVRAPGNVSCGNDMSVVAPFVDEAVLKVAARFPELVRVGPKFEAASCELFKNGGPHFTEAGRAVMARHIAEYFASEP